MHASDWKRETGEDAEDENRVFILVMSSCLHSFRFQLGLFILLAAFHAHSGFKQRGVYLVLTGVAKRLLSVSCVYVSTAEGRYTACKLITLLSVEA